MRRNWLTRALTGLVLAALVVPGAAVAQTPLAEADLESVKTYLLEHVGKSKAGTAAVLEYAQRYYDLAEASSFDYEALWASNGPAIVTLLDEARRVWVEEASTNYELSEGLVAGVPSLAYYDVWIDAGPSGEDDPANALDVSVTLPDGRVLEKPGSLYHYVTEPALWGTRDDFVGLRVDMDGDGAVEVGEALPETNALLGAAQALDAATAELEAAVKVWEPTPSDTFTALVIMIPTMSGYFEEWKESVFVAGEETEEVRFVGVSRLADVSGILQGLDVTYGNIQPAIDAVDPAMAEQIEVELGDLLTFVQDLYEREAAGTQFTPEQADQFGAELQSRATGIAGQISQAAALLDIPIQEC
ncbi:MAG: EfeM/EfeO family lipoprotein [Chloroflexia bacterium]|nr:EfeM/EfeO family lipoprotein [Chloroflexia bacterium]